MATFEIDLRLDCDKYSASDLRALALGEQVAMLNEILAETKRLGDLAVEAVDLVAKAQIATVRGKTSDTVKALIEARATKEKLAIIMRARKQQASILQTILRSPAA